MTFRKSLTIISAGIQKIRQSFVDCEAELRRQIPISTYIRSRSLILLSESSHSVTRSVSAHFRAGLNGYDTGFEANILIFLQEFESECINIFFCDVSGNRERPSIAVTATCGQLAAFKKVRDRCGRSANRFVSTSGRLRCEAVAAAASGIPHAPAFQSWI